MTLLTYQLTFQFSRSVTWVNDLQTPQALEIVVIPLSNPSFPDQGTYVGGLQSQTITLGDSSNTATLTIGDDPVNTLKAKNALPAHADIDLQDLMECAIMLFCMSYSVSSGGRKLFSCQPDFCMGFVCAELLVIARGPGCWIWRLGRLPGSGPWAGFLDLDPGPASWVWPRTPPPPPPPPYSSMLPAKNIAGSGSRTS